MEDFMPLLQVRDFPGDVYDEIAFEAKRQNRTIAQQTIVLIKKGLGEEISNQERRRRLLEKTMERTIPEHVKAVDHVKLIREDRNR
jgi:hypothetical protein